jgi:hypothetical protein
MSAPSTDRGAVQQIIRALRAADYQLVAVNDGEELVKVSNEAEALAAIFAVDEATLVVTIPRSDGRQGGVFFVLGNDPEEVAADWHLTLSPVLDPLTRAWWS